MCVVVMVLQFTARGRRIPLTLPAEEGDNVWEQWPVRTGDDFACPRRPCPSSLIAPVN